MVMWDKDSCSDAGFLKIDLLGLGMLSAVERCVEMIHARRGERIDLSTDPDGRPRDVRVHPEGRDDRRLPDREPRADGVAAAHAAGDAAGPHDPGRDRAAGADRRRRGQPLHRAAAAAAGRPVLRDPLRPPVAEGGRWRTRSGRSSSRTRSSRSRMAFAGLSPGEAEGLRRAMSAQAVRRGDRGLPRALRATGRWRKWDDVDEALAERVWTMVKGFSGFGFPKAHGAAFGLLAYQSTWLRVHYGTEFLASLLDEQPMGFYPPDALVHEAQRRGIAVLPPDVNATAAECTVVDVDDAGTRRRADRPRLRAGRARATTSRRWSRRARRRGRSGRSRTSRRARARGGRRWSSSRGRARATRWRAARGGGRCGSWAWPRRASGC